MAAYTKFCRLYDVYRGNAHQTAIALHRKYGPLVRIAPNHVSISDPSMIPVIYSANEAYTKTAFYPIQSISWKKQPTVNLFSARDPEYHRVYKRKVGAAYSLPSILQSETAIDSCTTLLMERLGQFVTKREPVDLGDWLHYCAFDVVGEVTFARKFGILEQGKDIDGMIKAIKGMLAYAALCGQVPEFHKVLLGNPLFTLLMPAMETWDQVVLFTLKAINERASIKRDGELLIADVAGRDMLSRWASIQSSDPLKMSTRDIVVHLSGNVFAGADTTAVALRAIVYFLCRHPKSMKKLVEEIDQADRDGQLSSPISFKETIAHLPYVGAVIKESMRLQSSTGLLMERHVPAEGVDLHGHHLPPGTIVGINTWVTNRDPTVFPDPESYRPERWLDATEAQLREMDALFEFNFGSGSRKCPGRHTSWVEMHKVIPQLFREYEVELTRPDKEWQVCNHWFVQQKGVICNLKRR